jgi:hypothetical protein
MCIYVIDSKMIRLIDDLINQLFVLSINSGMADCFSGL